MNAELCILYVWLFIITFVPIQMVWGLKLMQFFWRLYAKIKMGQKGIKRFKPEVRLNVKGARKK